MRIASILNEKEITLSCEVFPPKHFDGIAQASAVAQEIAGLHPSFMSVTYGAAGSTPGHTIAVAKAVAETGVTPLCHLTCVQSTREHVQHVLADMKTAGMENVLALRGDLPKEGEPCHDFAYAAELIDFIHQQGDFCVGAACYPEGICVSTPIETYMSYALNRIFDTAIGVIAALLVNYFLPRPRVVSLWEGFKGSFKKDSKV